MKEYNLSENILIFGQNINIARKRKNLDICELSLKAHYDRNNLSQLKYGEHNISYKAAINIARALNVSFPQLFSRNFFNESERIFFEDDFLRVYSENIKRELKMRGIIQSHIYIESGIQEASVSRILNGKNKNPTLQTLSLIAGVVDNDLTNLFSRSTERG